MILFLNRKTINRTKGLDVFFEELEKKQELYNAEIIDIANKSITQIKNKIQEAELLVIDTSLILSLGNTQLLTRNLYIDQAKKGSFFLEIWSIIEQTDKPLFLLHPASDLQAVNFGLERSLYLSILKRTNGIFWAYHKCPFSREDATERYPLDILKPYKLSKNDLINIWDEVRTYIPISIDFARCISDKEMNQKNKKKKWDVIVPGMTYLTRRIASHSVQKAGLNMAPYVNHSKWSVLLPYMVYSKILSKKKSTLVYQRESFRVYRSMISHSAVSFACGSELRYFVRKFLEIPAFRSAMIAYPAYNMADYGFMDGVHYLESFPEETGEKTKYLLKNSSFADSLVNNAYELVQKEHTATVKVKQVMSCIESFLKGKLKGAGYEKGSFEIIEH